MRIDSIWGRSLRTISARTDFIIPMAIAMEHHIPVLPIAVESGLEEYFAVEMNRIHDGYGVYSCLDPRRQIERRYPIIRSWFGIWERFFWRMRRSSE